MEKIIIKNRCKKGVAGVLFCYWIVLVIWQALTGYSSGGNLDSLLKIVLIFGLSAYFIFNSKEGMINEKNILYFLIYVLCMLVSFSFEKKYSLRFFLYRSFK